MFSKRYGIIGSGKLARHFTHYLKLLGFEPVLWNRHQNSDPAQIFKDCEVNLLLISDSALSTFRSAYPSVKNIVHCSGSLTIPDTIDFHPLMTFSDDLYDLRTYSQIPFVTSSEQKFSNVMKGLPNRCFQIKKEKKALYHSLCVLSGNFTNLLWEKSKREFETLGLPPEILFPYLERTALNIQSPKHTLTGPLVRGDFQTIQKNINSLEGDVFQEVYKSFVKAYQPERKSNEHLGL